MGYTHYYHTAMEYDAKVFEKVAIDFKRMITPLRHLGVILADGMGENYPIISPTEINFNGLEKCGHKEEHLGITWPSKTASGVLKNDCTTKLEEITRSQWCAGAELESRACGGDCSHETFSLEQKEPEICEADKKDAESGKLISQSTKTSYKPYDLAVNVCLIIAKHYFKDQIEVTSDGKMDNWIEGKMLCQHFLGYGENFNLDEGKN